MAQEQNIFNKTNFLWTRTFWRKTTSSAISSLLDIPTQIISDIIENEEYAKIKNLFYKKNFTNKIIPSLFKRENKVSLS